METLILAQAQGGGNALSALFPFLILFVLFYVMIIMPQRKQQKEHGKMVAALQKGDRVATTGGLIGEIAGIKEDEILLKTGQSTVVVERHRVARRISGGTEVEAGR
jgi:preprotein translocase subunit YajC